MGPGRTEGPRSVVEARVRRKEVALCLKTHVHRRRRAVRRRKEERNEMRDYVMYAAGDRARHVCGSIFAVDKNMIHPT